MKRFGNTSLVTALVVCGAFGFISANVALAATTPSLGTASTYGILSSTFTRNIGVTTITGDLGYTTLSGGGTHTVTGSTFVVPPAQAGTDQASALSALASQSCTFTFASGAIDLATDTTHGPVGIYTPGVYCTTGAGAASIGTAGITLSGSGTFIFRINGALTSVMNSSVTLANAASSCDVFWTPTAATTLGANSTFVGTNIDDSGITVGNLATWLGRALSFNGTVITDSDIINSTCNISAAAAVSRPIATINVVKVVINDNGGTKKIADFPLFVNGTPVVSGITNTFPAPAGKYVVTETGDSNYVRTFSGDCGLNGGLNLIPGDNKFCIVTNNDIGASRVIPVVPPLIDVVKTASPLSLPAGPGLVNYTYTLRNIGTIPVADITMVGDTCSPIILASGDTNANAILEVNETWTYRCSTTLTETHTNTVVATGWANGISAVDIASATVVVGLPIVPPLIHITKTPVPFTLASGGGMVTYIKRVTNPGIVALSNVRVIDDLCSPITYNLGDTNADGKLDITETWIYTCRTNLTKTTTNTASVTGEANGLTARDFAVATVVVAAMDPKLPNTGYAPMDGMIDWRVLVAGIFMFASIAFIVVLRKRII